MKAAAEEDVPKKRCLWWLLYRRGRRGQKINGVRLSPEKKQQKIYIRCLNLTWKRIFTREESACMKAWKKVWEKRRTTTRGKSLAVNLKTLTAHSISVYDQVENELKRISTLQQKIWINRRKNVHRIIFSTFILCRCTVQLVVNSVRVYDKKLLLPVKAIKRSRWKRGARQTEWKWRECRSHFVLVVRQNLRGNCIELSPTLHVSFMQASYNFV